MSSVVIQGDTSGSVTIQAPAISGTTIINLPTVTGGSFIVGDSGNNVSLSSNLTFTGTASRIIGDMTSSISGGSPLAFQTSTANSFTQLYVIPNGTSKSSYLFLSSGTSADENFLQIGLNNAGSQVGFTSGILGTGTYRPMTFSTGGSEAFRVGTGVTGNDKGTVGIGYTALTGAAANNSLLVAGNVGIGTNAPRGKLDVVSTAGVYGSDTITFGPGTLTYPTPQFNNYGAIVAKGAQADARLMVQDGNGRINNYWNAYTDTGGYKYMVSGEPAARDQMSIVGTTGAIFNWFGAPAGTAGTTLSWTQIAAMASGTGGYTWFSPRGTSSDFYIDAVSNVMVGYTSTTSQASNSLLVAGNVGIGTSSPATKLNVIGDIQLSRSATASDAAINFGSNSNNYIYSGNFTNIMAFATNNTERMRIDSSGNVGIGTAPANLSSSSTALTVNTGTAANFAAFELASAGTLNYHINANNAAVYHVAAGARPWIVYTNGSERMRIDSSGNVGIGTSSPGTQFNVYKSTATAVNIRPQNSLAYADFGPQADGSVYGPYASPAASTQLVVGTSNSNPFTFYTNGTERMRIDSSGNVGIGTTSPVSTSKLTVNGSISVNGSDTNFGAGGQRTFIDYTTNLARIGAVSGGVATGTALAIYVGNVGGSGFEAARIDSSGFVSIGTSTVASKLYVVGDTNEQLLRVGNSNATGTQYISIYANGAQAYYNSVNTQNAAYGLHLWLSQNNAGTVERMRIDGAGNLQIASSGSLANLFLGMSAIPGSMGNAYLYANTGVVVTNNGAANPYYQWYNTQGATDKKTWRMGTQSGGNLIFETVNDAYSSSTARMNIDAGGNVVIGGTTFSTNNGAVDKIFNVYGANNVVFGGVSSNTNFGTCFEASRTGRTGATRFAQISIATDASDNGIMVFYTAPSGSGVTERMRIDSSGYVTNSANGNGSGIHQAYQYYRLNTTFGGTNATGAQNIFPVSVTLAGSTVYEFELVILLTKTAGTTSHTVGFGFGGTATLNNIAYYNSGNPSTISGSAAGMSGAGSYGVVLTAASTGFLTSAQTNAALYLPLIVKGTVSINAGGTFIPQYTLSAAPGGAYSTQIGSYFKIAAVSAAGANTAIGTWA